MSIFYYVSLLLHNKEFSNCNSLYRSFTNFRYSLIQLKAVLFAFFFRLSRDTIETELVVSFYGITGHHARKLPCGNQSTKTFQDSFAPSLFEEVVCTYGFSIIVGGIKFMNAFIFHLHFPFSPTHILLFVANYFIGKCTFKIQILFQSRQLKLSIPHLYINSSLVYIL